MQALLHSSLYWAVRLLVKPLLGPPVPIALQRAGLAAIGIILRSAAGVSREFRKLGGVRADWVQPDDRIPDRVLIYLHGGAYVIGSPHSHRAITTHLARDAQAVVVAVDYRLAPEHPYPAALDDVLAVYTELLRSYRPEQISLVGDSAGANLALVTAIALRDRGLPLPDSIALIAPWVDMTGSGDSIRRRASRDPMLRASWIASAASHLGGNIAHADPRLSPLFADLRGLPRLLIHVGSEEILFDDSQRLHARATAAGIPVTLKVWEGQWHVFQLHAGVLAIADQALAELAAFVRTSVSASAAAAT